MTSSPLVMWGLGTPDMDRRWDASGVVGAMLRFESALALAIADAGLAPEPEARAVADACAEGVDDPVEVMATTWESGTPLLALIEEVGSRLAPDERRWLHYGATTQDAVDTAHMLIARDSLESLDRELAGLAGSLRDLMTAYRGQPQMGRTFLRDARPVTFGLRVAGWLAPVLGQIVALRRARSRLAVQLGGPVGSLAAYGEDGMEVVEGVANRLELAVPVLPWHADRSQLRALVSELDSTAASLAKAASDVALLGQPSIGELRARRGRSSSMPEKENPVDAVRVLAAAAVCHGAAGIITGARPHELERSLGSLHAEWAALPLVFSSASAAVEASATQLASLEVDSAAMTRNAGAEGVESPPGLIDGVMERYSRLIGET